MNFPLMKALSFKIALVLIAFSAVFFSVNAQENVFGLKTTKSEYRIGEDTEIISLTTDAVPFQWSAIYYSLQTEPICYLQDGVTSWEVLFKTGGSGGVCGDMPTSTGSYYFVWLNDETNLNYCLTAPFRDCITNAGLPTSSIGMFNLKEKNPMDNPLGEILFFAFVIFSTTSAGIILLLKK